MSLTIDLCQIKSIPGDLDYNLSNIISYYESSKADLVVFPELSLTGYNCQDLFLNHKFLLSVSDCLSKLQSIVVNKSLIIGLPRLENNAIYNSALLISERKIVLTYDKFCLPNYDNFDEKRYFSPGNQHSIEFYLKEYHCRLMICEDMWEKPSSDLQPVDVTIVINASPFCKNKLQSRMHYFQPWIKKGIGLYVNSIGGQDRLVFDGSSFVINSTGSYLLSPQSWIEKTFSYTITDSNAVITNIHLSQPEQIYQAIMLSLYDYFTIFSFKIAIIGISGGIDSALVATIAVDVLGPNRVLLVAMPSKYSSIDSINDALQLAKNLNCSLLQLSINTLHQSIIALLQNNLHQTSLLSITDENIQPRIRAILLMALANEKNGLLLSTSNKSESAVGYTTIYGDMAGGFAPIVDLYKTEVYNLVDWRNKNIPSNHNNVYNINRTLNIIPINIINKEPSAELHYNQKDSDNLPPYTVLDSILAHLIEGTNLHPEVDKSLLLQIANLLNKSEFKRQQAPIGPKLSNKMLSLDRKYPIALGMHCNNLLYK
jgi:NAD+ synthetase